MVRSPGTKVDVRILDYIQANQHQDDTMVVMGKYEVPHPYTERHDTQPALVLHRFLPDGHIDFDGDPMATIMGKADYERFFGP